MNMNKILEMIIMSALAVAFFLVCTLIVVWTGKLGLEAIRNEGECQRNIGELEEEKAKSFKEGYQEAKSIYKLDN